MTAWLTPKTNWFGKRDKNGIYSGDYFEVEDALRIRDNTLVLIEKFEEVYPATSILLDFHPNDGERMMFDIDTAYSYIQAWTPTHEDYFDFHVMEYIVNVVRNLYHCNEGAWRSFSKQTEYQYNVDNDFYELDIDYTNIGYLVRNSVTPNEYIPEIRSVIGENGLWTDPYYQSYFFNYKEFNALERAMLNLKNVMGKKKQDKYFSFEWNFGIEKGF